jgi:hypothetical protein
MLLSFRSNDDSFKFFLNAKIVTKEPRLRDRELNVKGKGKDKRS